MGETEKTKAGRLVRRREKARIKREATGDTPQATAERGKTKGDGYDEDYLKKLGERSGLYQ
jgi:hypothetical protein